MSYVLAVDIGSSSFRLTAIAEDGNKLKTIQQSFMEPVTSLGMVEFDAYKLCQDIISIARIFKEELGTPELISIANQRATTVVWSKKDSLPVYNALGWQDLRNLAICMELSAQGISIMPNASATKIKWILDQVDPKRAQDLLFGTLDSYLVWILSNKSCHVTDPTNAAATALLEFNGQSWRQDLIDLLKIPHSMMPKVVPSTEIVAVAPLLSESTKIGGILGDQQASMVGQAVLSPSLAKATFGTGAMCDTPTDKLRFEQRGPSGTFPIVTLGTHHGLRYGLEAMALSAGSALNWLKDDMGLITSFQEVDELANQASSKSEIYFVPALFGLGTPYWDFGARACFVGLTLDVTRSDLVKAVLKGIAFRGAELIESLEKDAGIAISEIRVDGGLSQSEYFLASLADISQRIVKPCKDKEATTLGVAYLGQVALGIITLNDIATRYKPRKIFEPQHEIDRTGWLKAVEKSRQLIPELSSLSF